MSAPDPVVTGFVLAGALQAAKQAQEFLAAAIGHPGESLGSILGNIMHQRVENAEGILSSAHLTLLNIGVTAKEIPLNVLQPALEAASLQEDDSLKEAWTNLLANAADSRSVTIPPSFPRILAEMSPREARFLNGIFDHLSQSVTDVTKDRPTVVFSAPLDQGRLFDIYVKEGMYGPEDFCIDLDGLIRLRLMSAEAPAIDRQAIVNNEPLSQDEIYRLTSLGYRFILVCRPPAKS